MTAEWTKQTEEMVKNWTGMQQKMMESMFGMMGMSSMGENTGDMWNRSVDTWHETVKSAIENQAAMAKFFADSYKSMPGVTPQLAEMANRGADMTRNWSEGQMKLVSTWFEAMKSSDPSAMMKNMNPEEMMKMMQTWQDASQKMMETQIEMMRAMTGGMQQTMQDAMDSTEQK